MTFLDLAAPPQGPEHVTHSVLHKHFVAVALISDLESTCGWTLLCEPFAQCLRLARFGRLVIGKISASCHNLFLITFFPASELPGHLQLGHLEKFLHRKGNWTLEGAAQGDGGAFIPGSVLKGVAGSEGH